MLEQKKLNMIKPKTTNKLMEKLVFYVFENYTMYPSVDDLVLVCNSAIIMFGSLKDEEDGIVSIYNNPFEIIENVCTYINDFWFELQKKLFHIDPRSGIKSGKLYNAILYRRKQRGDGERSILNATLVEITDEQKNRVKHFLKTCCLPADKDALKVTLSQYKEYRRDLIHNSFEEYKSIWTFYFVCPDLVNKI